MNEGKILNFLRKFVRDYGITVENEEELFDILWEVYPEELGKEFLTFCAMQDTDMFEKLL